MKTISLGELRLNTYATKIYDMVGLGVIVGDSRGDAMLGVEPFVTMKLAKEI